MKRLCMAALLISASLSVYVPMAIGQGSTGQQVMMVTLNVVQNADGTQSVITPRGDLAPLPGAGVSSNVAEIYFGSQGGFWYTDRSGKTIDLVPTVQALQARRAQMQPAQQVPQYAPEPVYQQPAQQPVQQTTNNNSGSSALGTAAAAGVGAMAGSAISNSLYRMPYGSPMYYGPNGHGYYYNNGERREIDEINLNQNQKAVIYNKRQIDQQNKQQALQHAQANRQAQPQPQLDRQNFQRQEQWYSNQVRENPGRFKEAANNPFVSRSSGRAGRISEGRARGGGGGGRARGGGGRRR